MSKELVTHRATNLQDLVCQNEDSNCSSPQSFSTFKLIGNDISDNFTSLEKVVIKQGFLVLSKTETSLSFSNNDFLFEFFISENMLEFKIRAQKKKSDLMDFISDSPTQLIEKIKFDFFQKNY